jgi:putative membrane protein
MLKLAIAWIANSLAILVVGWGLGLVWVATVPVAFVAGAVLTVVNAVVRPILVILTLPLTVLTLGLFYFVITGFCLWLTAYFIPGFDVRGVFLTILASVLIGLVSMVVAWGLKR